MIGDRELVFGLLAVVSVLFASNRVRLDVIALLTVLALILSGILTVGEALSGFGSPVVILVAGLLVVGEMLDRTGIASAIGDWILRIGGDNQIRLLVLIMLVAGLLGCVMSSTAVVAILIPVVLKLSASTNQNASRLLMPMAYAALISGMLTLIATTPNLVVRDALVKEGLEPLGFFSFTGIGVGVLLVAIVYIVLIGRHLVAGSSASPDKSDTRTIRDLKADFGLDDKIHFLRLANDSNLVGQTISEAAIGSRFRLRILGIIRSSGGARARPTARGDRVLAADEAADLRPGDVLVGLGNPAVAARFQEAENLSSIDVTDDFSGTFFRKIGMAVVLIHPECGLIGETLQDAEFRSRFGVHVAGIRRSGEALDDIPDVRLGAADSLLVVAPWNEIALLQKYSHDFIVLELPQESHEPTGPTGKAVIALLILALMVGLSILDVIPLTALVLMAALAALFTRCLTIEEAYRSIHLSSLVLIAGMLPVADALEKTGGIDLVVNGLKDGLGSASPYAIMSVLFFLTAALGLVLSNTASAVLMAPVAIGIGKALNISPYPLAIVVLIAASAAFVTPFSTPVVTLVVEPGRYRFIDFVKVGLPMLLLTYATTLALTPFFFPF